MYIHVYITFQKTVPLRRESNPRVKKNARPKFPVLEEESGQEESKMEGGREKHEARHEARLARGA